MRLLEVYTPYVDSYVRYKVMDPNDVEVFVNTHESKSGDEYKHLVLETVIYNLKSEVSDILKQVSKEAARRILDHLYNGCVMLNPGLDVDTWLSISSSTERSKTEDHPPPMADFPPPASEEEKKQHPSKKKKKKRKTKPITKAKFLGLEAYLKNNVVGQDEAIAALVSSLKRTVTGLADDQRPLGVFLFAGASGIGKTELAKQLHTYLFGEQDMVRIDCGEYQHKHENQKLIGSPPGYVGYDDGGHLTKQLKNNPRTVVLLDEVEKAHNDIWNTFLRVFDEGILTDNRGREISFRESIIVMTTNLGNREIVDDLLNGGTGFGSNIDIDISNAGLPPRALVEKKTLDCIRKNFRPEFLNRIDRTVVFNHLSTPVFEGIAELELSKLSTKLQKKGISINYGADVISQMIKEGVNAVEGARGLSRVRRDQIEDAVSETLIQSTRWPRGTVLNISFEDDKYCVEAKKPTRKKKTS